MFGIRRDLYLLALATWLVSCTTILGIDGEYRRADGGGGEGGTTTDPQTGPQSGSMSTSSTGGGGSQNGAPCDAPDECQSGHCSDSVCCNEACDGPCQSCTAVSNGQCTPHGALTDPEADCGVDMTCDGMGSCYACGIEPAPPGQAMCPLECTGGCTVENECVIACTSATCMNQAITCPADYTCRVTCLEGSACEGATITCPATYACAVECNSNFACRNAVINCGSGVCALDCQSGGQVCNSTQLTCGSEACFCSGSGPQVGCGSACHCVSC